jgi:predicted negative regulator of RcsB-dependent stress response
MTEQEQVEQLKNWVKQYGLTVLAGIVMACVLLFALHSWQRYHTRQYLHASGIFDEMLAYKAQNKPAEANVQANRIIDHYPRTPYAQMAAFLLAKEAVANKNYTESIQQLEWVIKHSNTLLIIQLAKIRIARIQVLQKKPEAALVTLNQITDKGFRGLADTVRGDIYVNTNDSQKAKQFYQLALQELPQDETTLRPLIQMKIDNLTTVSDVIK